MGNRYGYIYKRIGMGFLAGILLLAMLLTAGCGRKTSGQAASGANGNPASAASGATGSAASGTNGNPASAAGSAKGNPADGTSGNTSGAQSGDYDSADTAVVVKVNKGENQITFYNLTVDKNYTLTYDGITSFTDKFGEALSCDQIKEGDIVDVTFMKSTKRLNTLSLSASSWNNKSVSRYSIDSRSHNVTIGNDVYKITGQTKIFSEGEEVDLMDLNEVDVLDFYGIDTTVVSIVVEKGHGYLRLSGDESFIGGWIEVGQNQIRQITEDMLLVVPEGSYEVQFSTAGGGGTKNVNIVRNQETLVDISDFEIAEPQYGQVVFAMTPSTATLYVDGNLVDTSLPVTLQYGIHQLLAKADGYESVVSYLKVAEASAGIEIELESSDGDENEETGSNTTVSSGDSTGNTTTKNYYQVHIDAPKDVEVYVDGNYIGIAPISFRKTEGVHVVTLRKTGYTPRSYTVQVDSEDKDVSYSFEELEKAQ